MSTQFSLGEGTKASLYKEAWVRQGCDWTVTKCTGQGTALAKGHRGYMPAMEGEPPATGT
jgi:hypothetical protein